MFLSFFNFFFCFPFIFNIFSKTAGANHGRDSIDSMTDVLARSFDMTGTMNVDDDDDMMNSVNINRDELDKFSFDADILDSYTNIETAAAAATSLNGRENSRYVTNIYIS